MVTCFPNGTEEEKLAVCTSWTARAAVLAALSSSQVQKELTRMLFQKTLS